MAWVESHQTLGRHPKLKRLARALGIGLPQAVGHLHYLWWWALDYAQDGDLSRYEPWEIADAALWEGDPGEFVDALVAAGFADRSPDGALVLHDWADYAGRLMDSRAAAAQGGSKGNHERWHVRRGRPDPDCPYCREEGLVAQAPAQPPARPAGPLPSAGRGDIAPRIAPESPPESPPNRGANRPESHLTVPYLTEPNPTGSRSPTRAREGESPPESPPDSAQDDLPWQDDDDQDDQDQGDFVPLGDPGEPSWRLWYERTYAVAPPERWAWQIDRLVARGMAHEVIIAAIQAARDGGAGHPLSAALARLADAWARGVRSLSDWERLQAKEAARRGDGRAQADLRDDAVQPRQLPPEELERLRALDRQAEEVLAFWDEWDRSATSQAIQEHARRLIGGNAAAGGDGDGPG